MIVIRIAMMIVHDVAITALFGLAPAVADPTKNARTV